MISQCIQRYSSAARVAKHSLLSLSAVLLVLGVSHGQQFDELGFEGVSDMNGEVFGEQAEASQREQYVELIGSIDNVLSGLGNKAKHLADNTLVYLEAGKVSES